MAEDKEDAAALGAAAENSRTHVMAHHDLDREARSLNEFYAAIADRT